MPQLLSRLIKKKSKQGSGLSARNEHLKDQITDFIPKDYVYSTNGSKFICQGAYKLPSHVLELRVAESYDDSIARTRITTSEAQFYAESLAIIPSNLIPSPEDELRKYLHLWLADAYKKRFKVYLDPVTVRLSTIEELLQIYHRIDRRYTPEYLARLMFEQREHHILDSEYFDYSSGYLVLVLGDHNKYYAYTYDQAGEECAVVVNCRPMCNSSRHKYLSPSVFGVYNLVPLAEAKEFSLG